MLEKWQRRLERIVVQTAVTMHDWFRNCRWVQGEDVSIALTGRQAVAENHLAS